MYVSMGLSQGIMPLISYNFASGNTRRMKDTLLFSVKIALSFLIAVMILYYLQAGRLIGLFMQNREVISYGEKLLRGFCLGLPFLCIDFIAVEMCIRDSYNGTPSQYITILDGIREAILPQTRLYYAQGCHLVQDMEGLNYSYDSSLRMDNREAEAVSTAERADVVVLCLGLDASIEGEEGDENNPYAGDDRCV